jgi:hypothetical protein
MAKKVDFVADFKPVQMGHKDVLDKDLFIEAIRLIQNQSEKMRKFDFALDEALRMVCDGAIYVDLNNEYYTAALLLLERGMHDRADTISWWLTEGQHTSVTYEVKGVQVEKKLDTAEDLYEYLVDNDGEWGKLRFDFENGTAEIVKLADWDTVKSNVFAKAAIRFVQGLPETRLLQEDAVLARYV